MLTVTACGQAISYSCALQAGRAGEAYVRDTPNPNKLIVDVFLTRCRISMCQSLGKKITMKFRKSTVRDT